MTFVICGLIILILIFMGVSVPYTFMAGSTLFCLLTNGKMNWFPSTGYYALDSYSMLAMPLFIIAGSLMDRSGIAERLVDLGEILLRRVKGGLAAAIPVVSAFFGALSGSGVATASTISTMLGPRLVERGYDKRYIAAFVAAAAPLGFLIPPNVNAVIFAMVSECSIADLFLSTVFPAFILLALYIIINRICYSKYYDPSKANVVVHEDGTTDNDPTATMSLWVAFRRSLLAFLMPVIILGGIYSGIFTATEAGAVSCIYGLIIGCFVYKAFKAKDVFALFRDSAYQIGLLMMLFPFSFIFSRVMVTNGVPERITAFIAGITDNNYITIAIIAVIMLIAGCFLDANILLLVFTPLLMPTAQAAGMSVIQFAVVVFMAVGIGAATPPMAMCLFVSTKLMGTTVKDTTKPLLPFLIFGAVPTMLITMYVPFVSEWLPMFVKSLGK